MKDRLYSIVGGLAAGLVMPVITFFGYYKFFFGYMHFEKFYSVIFKNATSEIISLCLTLNLVVFFTFLWLDHYYAAKGVILASFLYGGAIVYLKFIA